MFPSMLTKYVCHGNGLINMSHLSQTIVGADGVTSLVAVRKTSTLANAHFTCNITKDIESLEALSEVDSVAEHFWIVTKHRNLKIDLLKSFKEDFTYWIYRTKPYFESMKVLYNEKGFTTDLTWEIIYMLFPPPSRLLFEPEIMQNKKYDDIAVGDQEGGIIACVKCRFKQYNPIWHVSDCTQNKIDKHLKSRLHNS